MGPARNDPCPCGSGRRYKHCCGALPQAAAVPQTTPEEILTPQTVSALAALVNQGRLGEAEQRARALLQTHSDDATLWKILGVARLRQGKDAVQALSRATELAADDAEAHANLGAALAERGRREEAMMSLRRALEIQPQNLQALIDGANTLCVLGRAREALPLYEQALRISPHLIEAHNNLGNALQELGDSAAAVACYRRALELRPADAEMHSNLANALRQLGQLEESVACSRRAIELAPRLSTAHNNLGLSLAALGRHTEAIASLRRAVSLNPSFAEALTNLGNVLCDAGEHREAEGWYRQAIELQPQRASGYWSLGNALLSDGRAAEAEASFGRALALQPDYPAAHAARAAALRLLGRAAEAEASCRAALASDPNHVEALSLLGDLHVDRGDFEQAQELFQRALALQPDSPAVLCSIAAQRRMTGADSAWLQGAEALLAGRLPLEHEIGLRFALGKSYDDLGRYEEAFRHFRRANELSKRHASPYERGNVARQVDNLIASFDAAFLDSPHPGASASPLPVLIVGMPRSGTSLIEQILASHPEVFGAGEVSFWESAGEKYTSAGSLSSAAPPTLAGMARDYLAQLTASSGPAARVTDKMPANFLYAGLIHAVFPEAKILHVQRHPLDTCLSIYFQNFPAMRAYATDLDNLAHYYSEYLRITDHWRAVLPASTLLEIPYEALIADQEGWTRRMLDFIGLSWSPQCLDFHRTERVVITASRWQVRQRINAASVGRWRNYEKYLGPLKPLWQLCERQERAEVDGVVAPTLN
jgi:tetratricopeptide (TPR) repeat protein